MWRIISFVFALVFALYPTVPDAAIPMPAEINSGWTVRCIGTPMPEHCTIMSKTIDLAERSHWIIGHIVFDGSAPVLKVELPKDQAGKWVGLALDDDHLHGWEAPVTCNEEACFFYVGIATFYREKEVQRLYVSYHAKKEDEHNTWLYLFMPGFQKAITKVVGTQ